jgi:hypothetical protein
MAELDAPHPPERVFDLVADLVRYPSWLDIVPRVVPEGADAWLVDLRGRLGPFARSKRLRMVRTAHEPNAHVRFERDEHDGRSHSPWVLDASVASTDAGSRLTMRLHYGGGLFGPVLERVLRDEIERSRPRLLRVLDG